MLLSRMGALAGALVAAVLVALPASAGAQAQQDLVDTIRSSPDLSTFSRAIDAAGLTDTLRGPGPYTVWAPTNAGFDKLPPGQLDALLQNPAQLRQLLLYHIGQGPITAAQIIQAPTARTLQGQSIRVNVSGNSVHLNDATVTQPDVVASNGIIHVIDSVLIPPSGVGNLPTAGEADSSPPVALLLGAALLLLLGVGGRLLGARRVSSSE
jgi:uncharacterized surface protein with fasciclin (FAS1) repeats